MLEPAEVDLVDSGIEYVAAVACYHPRAAAQRRAQPRHLRLETPSGSRRRLDLPEPIDQLLTRHHSTDVQQQQCQQRPLQRPTKLELLSITPRLNRAKQPEARRIACRTGMGANWERVA
jgi:hypothetical protein